MLWQILVCTLERREERFEALLAELSGQIGAADVSHEVGIAWERDCGKMPVGLKRNLLVRGATASHVSHFDDDDEPSPTYVEDVHRALVAGEPVDVASITALVRQQHRAPDDPLAWLPLEFSIRHRHVEVYSARDGRGWCRYPSHVCAVRREVAARFAFPEVDRGEDHAWSRALLDADALKTERRVERPAYRYVPAATRERMRVRGITV